MKLLKRFKKYNKGLLFRMVTTTFMLLMASVAMPRSEAGASQATLAWSPPTTYSDGSPVSVLGGYKIFTGTASGSFTQNIDVGNVTSYTLSSLNDATTYYFAVTAYDASGVVSGFSNQAAYTTPAPPPPTALYALSATAGSGGSITPSGTVAISAGLNQTYTITPYTGYKIASVTVDGTSVGAVNSYTFNNINANHSISASFVASINSYSIAASAGTGGTISPVGTQNVTSGSSKTFTITPNSSYKIAGITVDGASVGSVSSYTFSNITANHTITASFSATLPAGTVVFADNSGGSQFKDSTGTTYLADSKFSGGSVGKTTSAIAGTTDDSIYQTERYGNFSYSIPVTNGNYNVTLKFAETYFTAVGKRVFSVKLNDQTVIANLDIYAKVGKNKAYDVVIPVSVTIGSLNVKFVSQVNNAKVSGILVKAR